MKPAPFEYIRAETVLQAQEWLAADPEARIIAGGQTLMPMLAMRLVRPTRVIDIAGIAGLDEIEVTAGHVTLGAMVRQVAVERSAALAQALPLLSKAIRFVGHPPTRRRGTIGGSVANADPAADYPAAVVGLDATIETNQRKIAADDFFVSLFETALEPGEIITQIHFRVPEKAYYMKFRHPASGYAVVGVMVAKYGSNVRVAVTGAGPSVFRHTAAEEALSKSFTPDAVANLSVSATDLLGDIHCSAEYRAHLVKVYTRRAVEALTR